MATKHPLVYKLITLIRERRYGAASQLTYQTLLSMIYRTLPHDGVGILGEEWDYLIILDACRYDVFREVNTIPGRLMRKISRGSSTPDWLRKNFDKYYEDLVYISSNPHVSNVSVRGFRATDHFFRVVNVWDFGWDKELNTVPPRAITEAALSARDRYPDKRMIIHYMQPHAPWIGETKLSGKNLGLHHPTAIDWVKKGGIWRRVVDLGISLELVREVYRDNLRLVLDEVETLVGELDGKIVVSADHGECFGEKFLIEHPTGIYVKELVEVPWLITEKPKKQARHQKKTVIETVSGSRKSKPPVDEEWSP